MAALQWRAGVLPAADGAHRLRARAAGGAGHAVQAVQHPHGAHAHGTGRLRTLVRRAAALAVIQAAIVIL